MKSEARPKRLFERIAAADYIGASVETFDRLRVLFEVPCRRVPNASGTGRRIVFERRHLDMLADAFPVEGSERNFKSRVRHGFVVSK